MGITESLCYYNTLFINQCSYLGVFVLMALESMIAPIPSELVMPFAGFLIFSGQFDAEGRLARDVIALRDEEVPGARPLLQPVMRSGKILKPLPDLQEARGYFQEQFALLPEPYKDLQEPARYPVDLSPGLQALQARVEQQIQSP